MRQAAPIVDEHRFRRQHDPVERVDKQLLDTKGEISLPWRAETLLRQLERRGDIDQPMRLAGEKFHALFAAAALDPLQAADMGRVQISGGRGDSGHGSERARLKISKAMDALGGHSTPIGAAAWYILGTEKTVHDWAMREGWGGKPIRDEVAKGILIGSLAVLKKHFGC